MFGTPLYEPLGEVVTAAAADNTADQATAPNHRRHKNNDKSFLSGLRVSSSVIIGVRFRAQC